MAQRTIQGSTELSRRIKSRRRNLGLTIEEAASRAGVGTKTWSRYEAGGSIRNDKCKGICRALNWRNFPDSDSESTCLQKEHKAYKAWSQFLEKNYGTWAALSFAIGSDMLLDYIKQDLSDLSSMPNGSHIGQLSASFIKDELPAQFLMRYDYDFIYHTKCELEKLRATAKDGGVMTAHSVMEELLFYLCNEEAKTFVELCHEDYEPDGEAIDIDEYWVFDLFDDMDIITYLYTNIFLPENHPYHFTHWGDQQF